MEHRQFRLIKNALWPFPTTIEVGPGGITNKGKCVPWQEISAFTYTVTSLNRALNYIIAYTDKSGGNYSINYMHTLLASKKKKKLFAELYDSLREGFITYHIEPKAKDHLAKIEAGESVTLKPCSVSKQGVELDLGKKGKVLIPAHEVRLSHQHTGGFHISSTTDKKATIFVDVTAEDARYLLALLNGLFPGQAQDLN